MKLETTRPSADACADRRYQFLDIAAAAGEEIIDTEHLMPLLEQATAQMRADEAGTAGNEDAPGFRATWHRVVFLQEPAQDGDCALAGALGFAAESTAPR